MRAAGRVVAEAIREMARRVRPGVTTGELDDVAAQVFARHGARSGPQLDYDFPGDVCISVDDECVHGIPGPRRLREGQLVKLDVTAELDGFYADACRTVAGRPRARRASSGSSAAAQSALRRGLEAAKAGVNVGAIGAAVQTEVGRRGFSVMRGAHRPRHRPQDPRGARRPEHRLGRPDADGRPRDHRSSRSSPPAPARCTWTTTAGRSGPTTARRRAHFEHTIVITDGAPILVTA